MAGEKQHGGKREGAGRPPGSLNKRSVEAIAEVAERFPDWSPLLHMAQVANDPDLPPEIRLDAAKAAAPYVHAKAKPVELDPGAYVALQQAVMQAKIEATAETISRPGLAERLARAKARVRIADGDGGDVSIEVGADDAAPIIDVTPHSRPAASAGSVASRPAPAPEPEAPAFRPILPRQAGPALLDDWSAPSRSNAWPESQAFADGSTYATDPYETDPLGFLARD